MAKIDMRPVHAMALLAFVCLFISVVILSQYPPGYFTSVAYLPPPSSAKFLPFSLIFGIWGAIVTALMINREWRASHEKAKRGTAVGSTGDMYTLIDRMLDNLNPDEMDYLRQRMDDSESRLAREDLHESLDAALDERETNRRRR